MKVLEAPERNGLDRITTALLVAALVLAFFHHADHALRVDHSGWPFRERVTPFTYSLLAYPTILFALFGPRALYWLRTGLVIVAAAFTLYAHIAVEAPQSQFAMWAHNQSVHAGAHDLSNAFGVQSPLLGILSVIIGMALNVTVVVTSVAMIAQGLRLRRLA